MFRLLRRWVTQPLLDEGEIRDRQDMVEEMMTSSAPVLVKLKEALYKLPDFERAITTIFHKKVSWNGILKKYVEWNENKIKVIITSFLLHFSSIFQCISSQKQIQTSLT